MAYPNPYDEFSYRTAALRASHPDRLATIATLFGMAPAHITRCRVLELGCGNGGNVIPMAYSLPESQFTAIDLAERPISAGKEMAAHLGLRNLSLSAMDILAVKPEFGEFDYIIAHGVYSWVPPRVQDKLLEVCRANLAPHGVAFVSYNAYPGSLLKTMARHMFQFFVRPLDQSPTSRSRARQLLEFAKLPRSEAGSWNPVMRQLSKYMDAQPDTVLAHDEMGSHYCPAYFHEFIDHAGRHNLQYLGEAQYSEMSAHWLTPQETEPLCQLDGDPLLIREQYMDFIKCRSFRQTLLCRRDVAIRRNQVPEGALRLLVASRFRPVADRPALDINETEEFRTPDGKSLTLADPHAKRLLLRLAAEWPKRVPVAILGSREFPTRSVGVFLADLFSKGLIEFQTHWLPYVSSPGNRPETSRLVRLQLDHQTRVTSREHTDVEIEDEVTRELLRRADGTRDRATLLTQLRRLDDRTSIETLENNLAALAGLALITS